MCDFVLESPPATQAGPTWIANYPRLSTCTCQSNHQCRHAWLVGISEFFPSQKTVAEVNMLRHKSNSHQWAVRDHPQSTYLWQHLQRRWIRDTRSWPSAPWVYSRYISLVSVLKNICLNVQEPTSAIQHDGGVFVLSSEHIIVRSLTSEVKKDRT